ncbi:6105_t:CDS:2 [Diversispora eburnea]|uniref:6105_t:CDS:1 n=1 Tax=Diversispora eburnea TaxID=1213867 RepID=A0A9N8V5G8_9GLOM|nr:6105_t:CDS:2 [Diversispora eburnea]
MVYMQYKQASITDPYHTNVDDQLSRFNDLVTKIDELNDFMVCNEDAYRKKLRIIVTSSHPSTSKLLQDLSSSVSNCFDPFGSASRKIHDEDQFYYLSSSSSTSTISTILQVAQTIPSEILIEICGYLHPQDLYSLASVCKRYRSLLWSKSSTTTQQIWRTSRLKYVVNLSLAPPTGMSEQQYIWLMVLLNKCMFCDERKKLKLTMYWEFRMYCCKKCLYERIDVIKTLNYYNQLKVFERKQWIKRQETKIIKFQLENEKYNNLHDQTRYDHTEKIERLLIKLHE